MVDLLDRWHAATMEFTVEDVLRMVQDRAALLRAYGNAASAQPDDPPDARVLSGLADLAGDIEEWAAAVHDALDPKALGVELLRRP